MSSSAAVRSMASSTGEGSEPRSATPVATVNCTTQLSAQAVMRPLAPPPTKGMNSQ